MDYTDIEMKANDIFNKYYVYRPLSFSLDKIISDHNINLIMWDLPNKVDGMLITHDNRKYFMGINKKTHKRFPQRTPFTKGHELGHYFCHRNIQKEFTCLIHDKKYDNFVDCIEKEANHFAAELLMPEFLVWNKINEEQIIDPYSLSKYFGVSFTAMVTRLCYLNIISFSTKMYFLSDSFNRKVANKTINF